MDQWNQWSAAANASQCERAPCGRTLPADRTSGATGGATRGVRLSGRKPQRVPSGLGRREHPPVDRWNPWSATAPALLRREAPRGRIEPVDRTSGATSGSTRGVVQTNARTASPLFAAQMCARRVRLSCNESVGAATSFRPQFQHARRLGRFHFRRSRQIRIDGALLWEREGHVSRVLDQKLQGSLQRIARRAGIVRRPRREHAERP